MSQARGVQKAQTMKTQLKTPRATCEEELRQARAALQSSILGGFPDDVVEDLQDAVTRLERKMRLRASTIAGGGGYSDNADAGPSTSGGASGVCAIADTSEREERAENAEDMDVDVAGASGRKPVALDKFTGDEVWMCLVAMKLSQGSSDLLLNSMCMLMNVMCRTPQPDIPKSLVAVRDKLLAMMPVPPTYVTFCARCDEICASSSVRPERGWCRVCRSELDARDVRSGRAVFITYSVRKQLELYLRNPALPRLVKAYRPIYAAVVGNREPYRKIVRSGHLSLSAFVEAAPVTSKKKKGGTSVVPVLLALDNVPPAAQLRFPIVSAVYRSAAGPSPNPGAGPGPRRPSPRMLLNAMRAEMEDLAATPVAWVDVDDGGRRVRRESRVYLTSVSTERRAKAEALGHNSKGFYGCPYCEVVGETVGPGSHPEVFRASNVFHNARTVTAAGHINGTKYPALVHQNPDTRVRTNEDRVKVGTEAVEKQIKGRDLGIDINGINGLPAIYRLPGFRDTWSHTSSSHDIILEAIVKRMLTFMVAKAGRDHTFRTHPADDWRRLTEREETVVPISELGRRTKSLKKFATWNTRDHFTFLLTGVALLCSDVNVIPNRALYEVWVHLANATYLLHHGRLDDAMLDRAEEEVKLFAEKYAAVFTAEHCTWTFHVLQHFVQLARLHGPAFLWDAFNFRQMLAVLVKDVKKAREVVMGTRHFMLRRQAFSPHRTRFFHEDAVKYLHTVSIDPDAAKFTELVTEPETARGDVRAVALPHFEQEAVKALKITREEFRKTPRVRVLALKRYHQILKAASCADDNVDDSYVQLDNECFGQIMEMLWLSEHRAAFIMLRKLEKVVVKSPNGDPVVFPINQFPARCTGTYRVFHVSELLFVQKMVRAGLRYDLAPSVTYDLFSICPNEWFRFE